MKPLLSLFLAAILALAAVPSARCETDSEDADWKAVQVLKTGPQTPIASRDEARKVGLAYLAKQEDALRSYLSRHPGAAHTVDAQLRLAHLLAIRSDLLEKPAPYEAAVRLLDDAAKTAPEPRRADVAFAKIALAMGRIGVPTDADREMLTTRINLFQRHYPSDRRIAPLLAEVATLYDTQPHHKREILKQALEAARTEELRARITDDMKRLELLGRPVTVAGATAGGVPVDVADQQGKVVLVYFFASWSPPSVAGLDEVAYLKKTFRPAQLEAVGVSLDPTKEALEAVTKAHAIDWPVIWDGHGWDSPLVRKLAINALPTLWILDKHGNLRTLNAKTDSEGTVRMLIKEK